MKQSLSIFFKNENGFGVLQSMMMVGVVGIISLGVANYTSVSNKAHSQEDVKRRIDVTQKILGAYVNDAVLCKSSVGFLDSSLTSTQIRDAALTDDGVELKILARLPGMASAESIPDAVSVVNDPRYKLKIKSIKFKARPNSVEEPNNVSEYVEGGKNLIRFRNADFIVSVQEDSSAAQSVRPRVSRMQLVINDTATVESCNSDISEAQYCTDLGGDYNVLRTPHCVFRPADVLDCSTVPGGYIKDFDSDGNAICAVFPKMECPAGEFIVGYNDLGQPFCEVAAIALPIPTGTTTPTPTQPPASTYRWVKKVTPCEVDCLMSNNVAACNQCVLDKLSPEYTQTVFEWWYTYYGPGVLYGKPCSTLGETATAKGEGAGYRCE
jgi:hypothetical protein